MRDGITAQTPTRDYITTGTGWSKETVDCNFLLTDPKISKSVKTQWFLGSLYREVLVFWCLKNARCVEFCLSRFSNTKQAAPKMAWTLRCSLGGTQTLNKSINNSQIPFERLLRHPSHSSRQHGTLKDAVRHQKAPTDTRKAIQCEQEPPRILEQPFGVPGTVCWCSLVSVVSVGVCSCPELSWDTWSEWLWTYEWSVCIFMGFGCV